MGEDGGHGDEVGVEAVDSDDLGDDRDDESDCTGNRVLEDSLPQLVGLPVPPDDSNEPLEGRFGRHGWEETAVNNEGVERGLRESRREPMPSRCYCTTTLLLQLFSSSRLGNGFQGT